MQSASSFRMASASSRPEIRGILISDIMIFGRYSKYISSAVSLSPASQTSSKDSPCQSIISFSRSLTAASSSIIIVLYIYASTWRFLFHQIIVSHRMEENSTPRNCQVLQKIKITGRVRKKESAPKRHVRWRLERTLHDYSERLVIAFPSCFGQL